METLKPKTNHLAIANCLLLLLAICVVPERLSAQDTKLIRISAPRSASAVSLWGFEPFGKKYGLRTEVNAAITNADMQRAVQSGGVEVAILGYQSPAIMAEQKVSNVKIISGASVGGQNLIMRRGVELRSWKDLEGKRIGRPPGTYVMILFTLAAQEFGVDLNKVELINTTAAGVTELQALKTGDLDGLLHWSPIIDRAVMEGYAYFPTCCDIGTTAHYGPGNQIIGANTDFLKDSSTALNFMRAFLEAQNYYNDNKDKAAEVIAQYTGASAEIMREALKRSALDSRVDVSAAINLGKVGPTFGFTKSDTSGLVQNFLDLNLLSQATGKTYSELSTLR